MSDVSFLQLLGIFTVIYTVVGVVTIIFIAGCEEIDKITKKRR